MVTHSKGGYRTGTCVYVPAPTGGSGGWEVCTDLPDVLGESIARTCDALRTIMETHGTVVSRLLRTSTHSGFRLVARDVRTGDLAGWVEWVRSREGSWHQWDEPLIACAACQQGGRGVLLDESSRPLAA